MSIQKTVEELQEHRASAISSMTDFIDSLIESDDDSLKGKADKLCYWITDWCRFLDYEPRFSPNNLRRYKRGEIIKVHLGFNVGSEEGGLHYAVVVEKDNPKSCPTVTVVPLTSVKPNTDVTSLRTGNVFLGNELFTSLNAKISATKKHIVEQLNLLANLASQSFSDFAEKSSQLKRELDSLKKMQNEIQKMKMGSIALVNQITTISKIRIYDPKTDHDVLSNIKLSNERLDLLDEEIRKKFTNF